jgi:hypothetical protein
VGFGLRGPQELSLQEEAIDYCVYVWKRDLRTFVVGAAGSCATKREVGRATDGI